MPHIQGQVHVFKCRCSWPGQSGSVCPAEAWRCSGHWRQCGLGSNESTSLGVDLGLVCKFWLSRPQFLQHCRVGMRNKQDTEVQHLTSLCIPASSHVLRLGWDSSPSEGERSRGTACLRAPGHLEWGAWEVRDCWGAVGSGRKYFYFLRVEVHGISPFSNLSCGSHY